MEPRFRGSASPVKTLCGSTTNSIPGAAVRPPVWQGFTWSRSQGSFWSLDKQALSCCLEGLCTFFFLSFSFMFTKGRGLFFCSLLAVTKMFLIVYVTIIETEGIAVFQNNHSY
jgi:hypothetical protein